MLTSVNQDENIVFLVFKGYKLKTRGYKNRVCSPIYMQVSIPRLATFLGLSKPEAKNLRGTVQHETFIYRK
ncbi:unnamed protein product [Allacma fusca]|uniref:Uncharacterized protein n=1 Tax=Allacma fusca TaxID=39272 RepID=A0A8J2JTP6_9HEXA|nr:unnamed protein product [Allacma fusca]